MLRRIVLGLVLASPFAADLNFLAWFAERCHEDQDEMFIIGPHTRGRIR